MAWVAKKKVAGTDPCLKKCERSFASERREELAGLEVAYDSLIDTFVENLELL